MRDVGERERGIYEERIGARIETRPLPTARAGVKSSNAGCRGFATTRTVPRPNAPSSTCSCCTGAALPLRRGPAGPSRGRHAGRGGRLRRTAVADAAGGGTPERGAHRACALGRPPDWPGFELLSTHPGDEVCSIEVKGRGGQGNIRMQANERKQARHLGESYRLHVVFDCATPVPRLCGCRTPSPSCSRGAAARSPAGSPPAP